MLNPYPILTDEWKRFEGGAGTVKAEIKNHGFVVTKLRKTDHPIWVKGFKSALPKGTGICHTCGCVCDLGLEDNKNRLRCEGCYEDFMDYHF